jgi:hypothetical protein
MKSVNSAIDEIETEIQKANRGMEAIDGLKQLHFIKSKLQELKSILPQAKWQNIPKFELEIARLIVDSWPLDNLLGRKICDIEYEYERMSKVKESHKIEFKN